MLHKTIRESLSKDDAKLLLEILKSYVKEWPNEYSEDRVNFLLAKLKRLSK